MFSSFHAKDQLLWIVTVEFEHAQLQVFVWCDLQSVTYHSIDFVCICVQNTTNSLSFKNNLHLKLHEELY